MSGVARPPSRSDVGADTPPTRYPSGRQTLARMAEAMRNGSPVILIGGPDAPVRAVFETAFQAHRQQDETCVLLEAGDKLPRGGGTIFVAEAEQRSPREIATALRHRAGCVLSGDDSLLTVMRSPIAGCVVRVQPLDLRDVAAIAADQLQAPDREKLLADTDSLATLLDVSDGTPSSLARILRLAKFAAGMEGAQALRRHHVLRASALIDAEEIPSDQALVTSDDPSPLPGMEHIPPHNRDGRRWAMAALLLIAGMVIVAHRREVAPIQIPAVAPPPAIVPLTPKLPPTGVAIPAGDATLPLPVAAAHVVVGFTDGDVGAALRAARMVADLREAGFRVADAVPVADRPRQTTIAYYFLNDGGAAADVARNLGDRATGQLAPPSAATPSQRPGLVRVLVPATLPGPSLSGPNLSGRIRRAT